ncbi:MAG: 16S rRNA (guanine(966)-N(2))-methyltransferase RsmD [Chloroflexota bacterium]|nr:16S rRNA (guanine(966)-N(2))-methyltransferase RsmD [Chloroflexota bacterium]
MRVITGSAKGHTLRSVPGRGTRPILDRVKESLFNILGSDIRGRTFLDLYAGTGSVGIEALSRGAKHCVFIDHAHEAVRTIHRNLETTKLAERAEVIRDDVFRFLRSVSGERRFDYIYVAPPQYHAIWSETLLALDDCSLLMPQGVVIAQLDPKEAEALSLDNLYLFDKRQYGNTLLLFYACEVEGEALNEEAR